MTAICKIDYGQFEYNKMYDYSYNNDVRKYYVKGIYSKTEFNKKQFDAMFVPEDTNKKSYDFNKIYEKGKNT